MLAEAYAKLQAFDMALVMLNEAPVKPQKPNPIIGVPKPHAQTQVQVEPNPNTLAFPREFDDEEEELLDLPARPKPEPLPAAQFAGHWKKAYEVLVEVMNGIGWDELLEVRARVFLMKEDIDSKRGVQSPGTPGGGQSKADDPARRKAEAGTDEPRPRSEEKSEIEEESIQVTGAGFGAKKSDDDGAEADEEEDDEDSEAEDMRPPVVQNEAKQDDSPAGKSEAERPADPGQGSHSSPQEASSAHQSTENGPVERPEVPRATDVNRRKRVCKPWLDSVFHALYEDLKAYYAWLSEEERQGNEEEEEEEDDGLENADRVSPEEWLQRAGVALRLQNLPDTERALRAAASISHSPRAWMGLMRLYSSEQCLKETLVAAHEFLECYPQFRLETPPPAPAEVRKAIFSVVAVSGLQKVRDAQDAIGVAHPAINE